MASNLEAGTSSHKMGCGLHGGSGADSMEVVGVPSYSTHWMGRVTPPRHVTPGRFDGFEVNRSLDPLDPVLMPSCRLTRRTPLPTMNIEA